jgi:hypothetical protein
MHPLTQYYVFEESIYTYEELIDEFTTRGYDDTTPIFDILSFDTYEDAMDHLDDMVLYNSLHEEGIN